MQTKLHLQETLRCILQSSKMIRFTFCSRRLGTRIFQARLELQVCQCCPCTAGHPMWSQPQGSICQVHRLGPQPGEPWPSDLTGASKGKPGSFCGQGAIRVVCKGAPVAPSAEPGVWSKGSSILDTQHWGGKSHLQSGLEVCLFFFAKPQRREIQQHWSFHPRAYSRCPHTKHAALQREERRYLSGFRASSATHLTNYLWNCCIHSHLNKNLSTRRLSFVAAGPLVFPCTPKNDGLEVMQIHYHFICWCLPQRQGT